MDERVPPLLTRSWRMTAPLRGMTSPVRDPSDRLSLRPKTLSVTAEPRSLLASYLLPALRPTPAPGSSAPLPLAWTLRSPTPLRPPTRASSWGECVQSSPPPRLPPCPPSPPHQPPCRPPVVNRRGLDWVGTEGAGPLDPLPGGPGALRRRRCHSPDSPPPAQSCPGLPPVSDDPRTG
jgi:hypothetical protein